MTTDEGVSKALAVAQRKNVLLWASIPCTGGSPWQRITKRLASARIKIAAHIELFKKLWASFVTVAEVVLSHGGVVAIEWPQQCAYWEREEVKTFLAKHNLVRAIFHGCAYGLVSKAASTLGMPIKKPWTVATNSAALRAVLDRHCSKDHEHIQCGGTDLRRTEEYTDELVDVIHDGFANHLRGAHRGAACHHAPALCASARTCGPCHSSPRSALVPLPPPPPRLRAAGRGYSPRAGGGPSRRLPPVAVRPEVALRGQPNHLEDLRAVGRPAHPYGAQEAPA